MATTDTDRLVPATIARRDVLGGISAMSQWRWLRDPSLGFPQPVRIRGRLFFRENELRAWVHEQANKSAAA